MPQTPPATVGVCVCVCGRGMYVCLRSVCVGVCGQCEFFFFFFFLFVITCLLSRYMRPVRAMAAACRCPRGQQPIFPPLKTNPIPNRVRVLVGLPDLLPPMTARQKKRRGYTRTRTRKEEEKTKPPSASLLPQLHPLLGLGRSSFLRHRYLRLTHLSLPLGGSRT